MAALTPPIPVILCGKTLQIGEIVTRSIQPEYQVIHFINSLEDAKADLGNLVAGRGPNSPSTNHVGTRDYSKPPRAVIFGRAFKAADVIELNQQFRGTGGVPVAWIAGDPEFVPPQNPGPEYAAIAANSVKKAFEKWIDAGGVDEDIVYY